MCPLLSNRNIQFYVSAYGQDPQVKKPVGEPTYEEARKFLIEAEGVMMKAVDSCYEQRKNKVCGGGGGRELESMSL